ncbi:hypothetical protein TWF506_003124 [Arthrobotrys conoides]|uniref:Uncharacterized protein n=1 Tax=Arthrobotrys conoides TaxID=74498 RepID=A0AAN8RJD7_9PEZI
MLFGDTFRLLVVLFIFQILLSVTGIQERFDNFAIRKGVEFRGWLRRRREKRDHERLGLEGGFGADRVGGSINDNAIAMGTDQNSHGARDIEAIGDTVSIMELERQAKKKLDYGTEPDISESQ